MRKEPNNTSSKTQGFSKITKIIIGTNTIKEKNYHFN